MPHSHYVLSLSCRNRPGIVASVTTCLFEHGADIREAQQFDDSESGNFFARIAFDLDGDAGIEPLRANFLPIAESFGLTYKLNDHRTPRRVMLLVSKFDHCLVDPLYRWRIGEIAITPTGIISNHPAETYAKIDLGGLPFHHLPITRDTKMEQESQIWSLVKQTDTDLVVLARYM
jgi:formyltetrahydrofolate deformylase